MKLKLYSVKLDELRTSWKGLSFLIQQFIESLSTGVDSMKKQSLVFDTGGILVVNLEVLNFSL
jgi:hypothetical protein